MSTCSSCIYGSFEFLGCNRAQKRSEKGLIFVNKFMRPLCTCRTAPVAINYYKQGKPYYRSQCGACLKGVKQPRWRTAGYTVKNSCDKCGFKSRFLEVFNVFHVDGDLNNCRPSNLKTVCANCQRLLHREGVQWRQGDLVPDL